MDIELQTRRAADVLGEQVVQGTIIKLVQIERERCLRQVEKIKEGIGVFEGRFGKKSDQIWKLERTGSIGRIEMGH